MLEEWRISGIVDLLVEARTTAQADIPVDAPHPIYPSQGAAALERVWYGLEALRDLAAPTPDGDGESLWAVLDRLDEDTLRWALAHAARELHAVRWKVPHIADED